MKRRLHHTCVRELFVSFGGIHSPGLILVSQTVIVMAINVKIEMVALKSL